MAKRIRLLIFGVLVLVALYELFAMNAICTDQIRERQTIDQQKYVDLLHKSGAIDHMIETNETIDPEELLVELIDEEGNIIYTNNIDPSVDRLLLTDVENATFSADGGSWKEKRENETILWSTMRRDDHSFLRLGIRKENSRGLFLEILDSTFTRILVMWGILGSICMALVTWIVKPIKEYAENPTGYQNKEKIYPELLPYIETIEEQKKDLEKNAKMKEVFTANMTHELKTPLASIMGYAEVLKRGESSASEQEEYGNQIMHHSERLLHLVEDSLSLSEIDLKEKTLMKKERFSLMDLAEMCVDSLEDYAKSRDVTLEVTGVDQEIEGDYSMIELMVYNLVSNAIRYNHPGGKVTVTVGGTFSVEDTGQGIPEKDLPHIFERFYRVDKADSRQKGGSGLGLAIVKGVADLHEAEITVKSKVGEGTRFEVRFPEAR